MLKIIHNFVWKWISVKCMEGEYITLTHLEVYIVWNKENFYFEGICFLLCNDYSIYQMLFCVYRKMSYIYLMCQKSMNDNKGKYTEKL